MNREENFAVDTPSPAEMKKLIAGLRPSERKLLSDPNFITEDEADLIMSDRAVEAPGEWISFDELLKREGITRRKTRV